MLPPACPATQQKGLTAVLDVAAHLKACNPCGSYHMQSAGREGSPMMVLVEVGVVLHGR